MAPGWLAGSDAHVLGLHACLLPRHETAGGAPALGAHAEESARTAAGCTAKHTRRGPDQPPPTRGPSPA